MANTGILIATVIGLAAYQFGPATHGAVTKMGLFRQLASSPLASPDDLVLIKDTVHCEDIHYYTPANTLFTACEDVSATRFSWFPPLATYDDPYGTWKAKGSIHTIDPQTKESKRLTFENFDGPFITHGIDVIPDPISNEAVYIFAINHVPNEAVFPRDGSSASAPTTTTTTNPGLPKVASRIEVFHHILGADSVRYIRTISHPLIRTPNDVYAVDPQTVYVSNDHHYLEGRLRVLEDVYAGAKWSDVIRATAADDGSVEAVVALDQLHNPNGMGHGRTENEILVTSAAGGLLWLGSHKREGSVGHNNNETTIVVHETIDFDSSIDNPSWFTDVYADETTGDASGFVIAGLTRAVDLAKTKKDPLGREGVLVWHVTASQDGPGWNKRLLWQDDGSNIRNAATGVLVGIDPQKEDGKKKAWLFVSGFSSENTVAVKVDL